MTNKQWILQITDKDKGKRLAKIRSLIKREYDVQYTNRVCNIIVPAKVQENKIALIAHHDVYPGSWGFNDNSTGVATLLKLQNHIPDNVELVFTDGEEQGGKGSDLYMNESSRPKMAINVDVVGLGDTIFYEEYGNGSIVMDKSLMEYYPNIPFSDSRILQHYGVPNVLLLTGYSHRTLISNIFEAQHCGAKDGVLDLIQEDVMNRVYDVILDMIEQNIAEVA